MAKKSLGQNFLKNRSVLEKMARSLGISERDTVVEIGPGHGELTEYLESRLPKKLIAVEKDDFLAGKLPEKFKRAEIVAGDALEVLPNLKLPKGWKLVGNIPYYITGRLLRTIAELPTPPEKTVLLVQKEVAERVCSRPPKANLLSSMVGGWAEASLLFPVGRNNFIPAPKVDSAVLALNRKKDGASEKYFKTAGAVFKQPRKTAANNLADSFGIGKQKAEKLLASCGLDENIRPQNFSPENIACVSRQIKR